MPAVIQSPVSALPSGGATTWLVGALSAWLRNEAICERPPEAWPQVWRLAGRHRCRGLLLCALRNAAWLTDADEASLSTARVSLGVSALTQISECRRIGARLREAGIPVLFFKGVALGLSLYGDATTRAGGDIDLLVDPQSVSKTLDCLEGLGYAPLDHSSSEVREALAALRSFDNQISLGNPATREQVEIHWRFFREHFPFESLAQKNPDAISGNPASLPTLAAVPRFLHLLEHGARHGFYAAQWLVDLIVQWRRMDDDEKQETSRLLLRSRLERKLALASSMIRRFLAIEPGNEGWPQTPPVSDFAMEFASNRFCAADPRANIDSRWHLKGLRFQMDIAPSWRQRLSFLFYTTITTPTLYRYPLPPRLHFLYPFVRIALLSARLARGRQARGEARL